MADDLTINSGITIPGAELSVTASRAGGPGGQHVNTTSSRVTLQWNVEETVALNDTQRARVLERLANRISTEGVLTVHADTERSQHRNRQLARERLVELVREALVEQPRRIPSKVPAGAKRRRLENKRRRAQVKRDRRDPGDDQ